MSVVLNFTQDPSRKTLQPLIKTFGRYRERMRAEAEMLERQLKHCLATFAQPDDATVRKVITKNEQRILAVYLHVRSGYHSLDLAQFLKVPKTTAYGWFDWFKSLPEGLRAGILAFMDMQTPIMAACQLPVHVAKQTEPAGDAAPKGNAVLATDSTHQAAAG